MLRKVQALPLIKIPSQHNAKTGNVL